jgi:tRNA threonylcarbamoyladenosine biosynthesis protein TsaE
VTGWPVVVRTTSPAATKDVAGRLARLSAAGDVILLIGDLGAGKTAFAQGFAEALGVEGPVTSPTFALVRQYHCAAAGPVDTLLHADVYRTGSLAEVVDLALAELVEERAIALVEWGDMAAPALGDDALEVTLIRPEPSAPDPAGSEDHESEDHEDERVITLTGRGRWSPRADEVAAALSVVAPGSAS